MLNGAKMLITNANVADAGMVYAKTDPEAKHKGVTAFIVDTATPGLSVQRVNCRVLGALMPTNVADVRGLCGSVATRSWAPRAKASRSRCARWTSGGSRSRRGRWAWPVPAWTPRWSTANSREAFGQKIGSFQMVKERLAEMVAEVAAARALVYEAAWRFDSGLSATRESLDREVLRRRGLQARGAVDRGDFRRLRVHRRVPIATYVAYAKLWQTGEGSANIQRILLADDALGWRRMDRHEQAAARA